MDLKTLKKLLKSEDSFDERVSAVTIRSLEDYFLSDRDLKKLLKEFREYFETEGVQDEKKEEIPPLEFTQEAEEVQKDSVGDMSGMDTFVDYTKGIVTWVEVEMKKTRRPAEDVVLLKEVKLRRAVIKAETDRQHPPRLVNVNDAYIFKKCLKKGRTSTVNVYYSKIYKRNVAIKCISKIKVSKERLFEGCPREVQLCYKIKHDNIVKFLEVFENDLRLYIVMEFVERGSLTKFLRENGKLDCLLYRKFLSQIAGALSYLHANDIFHRKLCSDNVLLTDGLDVKLCDFSESREAGGRDVLTTPCGILAYTAPEVLAGDGYRPALVDVWALGILLYLMVYAALPFHPTDPRRLVEEVAEGLRLKRYPDTPKACLYLLHNMLAPEHRRFALSDVMSHPWVASQKYVHPGPPDEEEKRPYGEVVRRLEELRGQTAGQVLGVMSYFVPPVQMEKLYKMAEKKKKDGRVPESFNWLYSMNPIE